ncbi:MAG: sodium-dependent transporter [Evtepia sp.]
MEREKFSSRLGFILIAAGCAIGLGNVYRFPIITGAYGGGLFVLIYVAFLLLVGIPVMVAELCVGRASRLSTAKSFEALESPGHKWHLVKYVMMAGNYLLMMFYTTIAGWMTIYFFKYASGSVSGIKSTEAMSQVFGNMVSNPGLLICSTLGVIVVCFAVCSLGLQKGVEKITKVMMVALFVLIVIMAVRACALPGALEGLKFYLVPSLENVKDSGIITVIFAAMGQAFFTLSIGMGSIQIFGTYIDKERSLLGEAITITALDTFVAIFSGLIIFPACFTYNGGVTADASSVGASFLFTTLSGLFNNMPGGRLWGTLFFLFMIFAAFSTVIAIFENIVAYWLELSKLSRRKIALLNIGIIALLALPAIFSLNIWSDITIFGLGFLDLEDFTVSNIILPLGGLVFVLFCTTRYGWGWDNFIREANEGKGMKFPKWIRPYMTYVLPVIILLVFLSSILKGYFS